MSFIEVHGVRRINGEITVQGSKNASLPMMAAALLHQGITVIDHIPGIQDVFCMMGILDSLGCKCSLTGERLVIDAAELTGCVVPEEEMKKMRSSIMMLGVLLGRKKEARVSNPGGCMIGKRPIDLHLMVLRMLGAEILEKDGYIEAKANVLKGTKIQFPFPSVGATENALFAAAVAEGRTDLIGCAREPEIEELCRFMVNMGVRIHGTGTSHLVIEGKCPLHDSVFRVGGDRIAAGTYLMAAAGSGGSLTVSGIRPQELDSTTSLLRKMGASVTVFPEQIVIKAVRPLRAVSVKTAPYPEFPTDLQSVLMAVLSCSLGNGVIEEQIFESRFKTAEELKKMGADLTVSGRSVFVRGQEKLYGTSVRATDLRGGAALVIAGVLAEGITKVSDCHHILRGYEDICRDLNSLGAELRYVEE